jgi:RHS repeat-associated protein
MTARRLRNTLSLGVIVLFAVPLSYIGPLGPINVLAYTWDASVDTSHVPTTWITQTSPAFDVRITNTGTATWPSGGTNPVHAAFYFSNQNRDTISDCSGGISPGSCRYALPADVASGGSVTFHVQKATPFDVGSYTFVIDLVQEGVFWFETQTPNLPVNVAVQVKVGCAAYCTTVISTNPTHYWRLNDRQSGAGPYRDAIGGMDEYIASGMGGTVSDGRLPADSDAGAASVHTSPTFQAEPNNNSLNFPLTGTMGSANVYALGGWVKQDSDQPGHGACFIEGSPVNGTGWLCRDPSGNVSFSLDVLCNTHDHFFNAGAGPLLDDGRWHYVLGRYQDGSNAEAELWVDGSLVGTAPKPVGGECIGTEPVKQIREVDIGQNFHGFFSEVAYWPTSLATSAIPALASVPVGGAVTTAQAMGGGSNVCLPCLVMGLLHGNATNLPVDTSNGNFWHVFTDVNLPGRSYPLSFVRTYNSLAAATNSPVGYGWQFNYAMSLNQNGSTVMITQENGSQASFTQSGTTWNPSAPRFVATLTNNPDGTWTFVRQGRDTYSFNSAGQLTAERDLNGYTTALSYTGGNLTSVSDQAGRSLTISWTGSSITTVTDANVSPSRVVHLQYNDGAGNLTDVIDVNSGHWQFTYDTSHRMTTMKDPKCYATTGCPGVQNSYDANGRVQWQKDQLNRQTSFNYGTNQTTVTDPKGNQRVDYYSQGLRTAVTYGYGTPQSATWQYFYDPNTLALTGVTDPNEHETTYVVDSSGNPLTVTDALGRTTTNTYNGFNELLTSQDPNGVMTTYTYNSQGDLTSTSRPLTGTSQTQVTTYNHADSVHPGDVTSMVDPDNKTSTYTYDTYGDRASITDPLGNKTTYAYNGDGWMTSSVTPKGNVAGCGCQSTYTTTYAHDNFGNVTTTTDPLGHQTVRHYDADQNQDYFIDGDGNRTNYVYDVANQQTQVQRADSTTLTSDYNADGTVLDQKDGKNNAVLTYGYDALARVTSQTDALNDATSYTYDGAGNRLTQQDPGGNCSATPPTGCTTFAYDAANQLKTISYSDGITPNVTNMTYDGDGQRTAMTDGTGSSTWVWDSLHRLTSYTSGAGAHVQYAYNLRNLATTITYPGALNVTRGYDDAGRVTTIQDWLGNTTRFAYDANSNLTTETLPTASGIVDTFTFDAADRLMAISDTKGKSTLFSATYTRDTANQLTSDSSISSNTSSYKYNALNELCYAGSSTSSVCSSPPRRAIPYSYDAADNLTQTGSTQQAFNNADQLCWTASTSGSCASPPTGATTFNYDTRGNRTKVMPPSGGAVTLTYDQANRLTAYGSSATYAYNGDGLRMSKTISGSTTQFLWDSSQVLPLLLMDGSTSYVYGPHGLPLEQINGSAALWLHDDQLGSTRLVTNSAGSSQATYAFDPYGNLTASTGTITNPFRFAGQYFDGESNLYYVRARYYDPSTGQFISSDPAAAVTIQPYAYVSDNPLNGTDPSGLCDWWDAICHGRHGAAVLAGSMAYAVDSAHRGAIIVAKAALSYGAETADACASRTAGGIAKCSFKVAVVVGMFMPGVGEEEGLLRFTADQDAVIQLAKGAKQCGGITLDEAKTLVKWAEEYNLPARGPEVHPWRPFGRSPHIHIGPINHIPII